MPDLTRLKAICADPPCICLAKIPCGKHRPDGVLLLSPFLLTRLLAVVEAAQYLVAPSRYESPAEVCQACGTYGVGELRDALTALGGRE